MQKKMAEHCREIDHIYYENFTRNFPTSIKLYTLDYNENLMDEISGGRGKKLSTWDRKVRAWEERNKFIVDYFVKDLSSNEIIVSKPGLKKMLEGCSEFSQDFDFG